MRILIQFPFSPEQIGEFRSLAASLGDHEVVHAENEEQARELAPEAEVILGHFPESVAEVAPRLRWIQSYSAGMNNFLYPSVIERDEVMVSNMAGLYAPQGGEHAWALLLALSRGLLPSIRNMAERAWGGGVDSVELGGGTLGVIGMGGFGREITKRAAGYGMRIIGLDPVHHLTGVLDVSEVRAPSADNLRWLLENADAVVVGCPLTEETYHMIGAQQLSTMKRTAYLVCVSR